MYSPNHLIEPSTDMEPTEDRYDGLMGKISKIYGEISKENANTDPSASTRMYQVGSIAAREYNLSALISPEFAKMHREGDWHIHDLDYYFTVNCMTHDLGRILKGFSNGVGHIREPKRMQSACALTAIILQSAQNNMFGGQAVDFFDKALAPYAEKEFARQKTHLREILKEASAGYVNSEYIEKKAMELTEKEVYQAMEALVYNLNTMKARSGNQVPFTSFNFGSDTTSWGRMVSRNLLKAFKAGLGHGEAPLFPNLCFRYKKGVNTEPGDPNYDIYRLALEVMAVRMHPTIAFMDSTFNAPYGDQAGYMGCRTRVMANVNGESAIAGRGNLFFTTLNLPRIGLKMKKPTLEKVILEIDRLGELAIAQLLERYKIACALTVKDLPFVMQYYMGAEGLSPDDPIEPAIKHGTLSMGFHGLAELLISMYGKHHGEDPKVQLVGQAIVSHMRKVMDEATKKYHLNFTLLATPAEGLSGRFTALDLERFGSIKGVTDHTFYTNSFHVPVWHKCTYEEKIRLEAPYHEMTNAGHISYVELAAPPVNNLDGLDMIIRSMAKHNMGYAGVNFPADFCCDCHVKNIVIDESCPVCGSSNIKRTRRITGYMSDESKFNPGKEAELSMRVCHEGEVDLCE